MRRVFSFAFLLSVIAFPAPALAHGAHPEMESGGLHTLFHGLEEGVIVLLFFAAFAALLFFQRDEK